MASDRKQKQSNSIPIRFFDGDDADDPADLSELADAADNAGEDFPPDAVDPRHNDAGFGGPELAELVASRAELKRLQTALDEAKEALARRQADFENYRKRIERERGEAHSRVVADVAAERAEGTIVTKR